MNRARSRGFAIISPLPRLPSVKNAFKPGIICRDLLSAHDKSPINCGRGDDYNVCIFFLGGGPSNAILFFLAASKNAPREDKWGERDHT